ncbi:barstar family protein [Actinoplanes sp. NPDC051475]|uniref:barstar family protein n=1 Tax=Actinoplanes sp. NPDC051475 TaxID=3157225 RepID=UPI00344BB849
MHVVIDGRFVLDEADLHRRLAGALGYGPYYRHDLDDLCARLSAGDPRPLQLVWIHVGSLCMALGVLVFDRYVAILEEIEAADTGRRWPDRFVFRVFE